jgi:hypothetical protein
VSRVAVAEVLPRLLYAMFRSPRGMCNRNTDSADNYHRDMNVFADDITIEDDMSVLVKYSNGATMTYHLTAYSVSRNGV